MGRRSERDGIRVSTIDVKVAVNVYEKDHGDWGHCDEKIGVASYWNDDRGDYATLIIDGHEYTVVVSQLTAALRAVTTR